MSTWVPIGPDFVFAPRDANFSRLSRRNENGRQTLVQSAAVDPTDPGTIYTVEAPTSGGNSAFRTTDGGTSWTPIVDGLQQTDPANVNASSIAINPLVTGYVYLGTYSGRVYTSPGTAGNSWNPTFANTGSGVFKLVVDPRTASNPSTSTVYAACNNGVWRSADGGATFAQVLSGNLSDFAAWFPTNPRSRARADFYAGIENTGILHAIDPTSPSSWTNLTSTATSNLPSVGSFDGMRIDICRLAPRPYVWFFQNGATASLYTAEESTSTWMAIPMTSPPQPSYVGWFTNQPEFPSLYDDLFAVAPNSPGNGSQDVLFFGSIGLSRSVDSGRTWVGTGDDLHGDYHSLAFFPDPPLDATIPFTYIGSDGGLGVSNSIADPTVTLPAPASDHDNTAQYNFNSPVVQNYSHGKQSSAIYQYNCDPTIAALGYIVCQDTGIAAGDGALTWRGIQDADVRFVAVARGSNGVKVWNELGSPFHMYLHTDQGGYAPLWANVTLNGSLVNGTSNFVADANGNCLAGIRVEFPGTTIQLAIAIGTATVTPASMANIVKGSVLQIDASLATSEIVTVTSVTSTTFTATFTNAHSAGATVSIIYQALARVDQSAHAVTISQDFGLNNVNIIAASPNNVNIAAFATTDQRLFLSTNAATATPTWTEITNDKPTGSEIASIVIDRVNNTFVLFGSSIVKGGGEFETVSPLFLIAANSWNQTICNNLPDSSGFSYGKLVADPLQSNVMYAGNGARVYQLTAFEGAGSTTDWIDISNGLPGQWIYDLWAGSIGTAGESKALLRAAVPTRGMWEIDITAGATDPALALYMRDNLLDLGRLSRSPDGVPNPYKPSDPGSTLYHYQCADIKLDAQQQATMNGQTITFFQTDPEGGQPLSHVLFDQLNDNSEHLPSADQANVHVQVRNRGLSTANGVWVWAVYSNAGAGLPALNKSASSGNNFNFWSQFSISGINPALPADSPWKSIGNPVRLDGISPSQPKIASWRWTVPTLGSGDPGHYCVAAFVQQASSQIHQTSFNLDDVTPVDKQIGQKNLHVGPALPSNPGGRPGGGGGGGAPGSGRPMLEYIEFHNPTKTLSTSTLVINLQGLPKELVISFVLTPLKTAKPLPGSITGVISSTGKPGTIGPGCDHHDKDGKHCPHHGDGGDDDHHHHCECTPCPLCQLLKCKGCHHHPNPPTSCPCTQFFSQFTPVIYTASPSSLVSISGVQIAGYGSVAAYFSVTNAGKLAEGSQYRFNIQQHVGDMLVGGSTYVVRIAGKAPFEPFELDDTDELGIQPTMPVWIQEHRKH
ncbi:hypothetical protein BKA64DRAFT_747836 [Cadophora sp. MPI-SDFR-AT-0126]|nr:hypothetical protein BKA64DRAFT_747836 [Leotiomycetes sp. MPI-SDFR-AT-0126]